VTIGPDITVDPAAAFLEAGATGDYVEPEGAEPHSRVAIVIAAGLLAAFALTAEGLMASTPPASPGDAADLVNKIWGKVTPAWMRISVEAFRYAIRLGSTAGLTEADVTSLAESYAMGLGDYANQTSALAVAEGFAAQLNAGWSPQLAWRRASMGYGLDRQQMKSFIQPMLVRPASYETAEVPRSSRSLLTTLLQRRAMGLADNESYHASQLGKTLVWQFQRNQGLIPEDAMKVWRTAHDEKVCAVCGPMDGVTIPLDEMFELLTGKLVCPGAHPNCRCTVELSYSPFQPFDLTKAYGKDPDTRDAQGQWATVEGRGKPKPARTRVMTREQEQVAHLLVEAAKVSERVEEQVKDIAPAAARDISPTLKDIAFDIAAPAKDIAGAKDIDLSPTKDVQRDIVKDLFRDTDFGADVRARSKTRKVVRIFWQPATTEQPAQEVATEEDETFDDLNAFPGEDYQSNVVVMNGADYFQALLNHMTSKEGKARFRLESGASPVGHPMFSLRRGSIIDFDAVGLGSAGPGGSWVPPSMMGIDDPEGELGTGWIPPITNWKAYQNSIGSLDAWRRRTAEEEYIDEEASMVMDPDNGWMDGGTRDDPRGFKHLAYLSEDQVAETAVLARKYGAVVPAAWKRWSPDERRDYVFQEWNAEGPREWNAEGPFPWDAALTEVTGSVIADDRRDSLLETEMQDATVGDVEPDLFVFHGHYGVDASTVEGKYLIDRIEYHNLNNNQRVALDEEISDTDLGDEARYKSVRVFHLEPYDAPWMPQTPADLIQGIPPIDELHHAGEF